MRHGSARLEVCRALKARSGKSAAIILLATGTVEARLSAFQAKADDCIEHPVDVRELAARANALALRCDLPPLLADQHESNDVNLPGSARSARPILGRVSAFSVEHGLSPQQTQILSLLATGLPLKAIGSQVGCEHSTVRTHLHRIALKVGCSGTREILAHLLASDGG